MATNAQVSAEIRPRTYFRVTLQELAERFGLLKVELAKGSVLEIIEEGNVVAEVRSPSPLPPLPDFRGRMKAIWGDELLPSGTMTKIISEGREERE